MSNAPASPGRTRRRQVSGLLAILAIVVALVAVSCWPDGPAADGPPPTARPETVVRLVGSNTIGAELAPDLAEGFLAAEGATDVRRQSGDGVVSVIGTPAGRDAPVRFEIRAEGTETGFTGLRTREADVAMASRRITAQEAADLATRGDLTGRASEHVLALDAVAVVVPGSNGVTALSIDQLRDVFTCTVTDWAQVGGRPGPIRPMARDARSGTFETFRDAVLAGRPLCPSAQLFDDSEALSAAVARDPAAIGFVGLPFVNPNRALELFDDATPRTGPTAEAVSTETYLLTRRLYLYLPTRPADDPLVRRFVEAYALGPAGQVVVERDVFLSPYRTPRPAAQPCSGDLPEYCAVTDRARRVPFDVRFDPGTQDVDNRAFRNLDLLVDVLERPEEAGKQVLLVGFADGEGPDDANLALSRQRAESVRAYLAGRGVDAVTSVAFGEALPVDTNDTPDGRQQNRRVEVWLR